MIYRVSFHQITRNRKAGTYARHVPANNVVTVSDYTVAKHGDYAQAAMALRPDLFGRVSYYRVSELKERNGRLVADHFMSGNDCPGLCEFSHKDTLPSLAPMLFPSL